MSVSASSLRLCVALALVAFLTLSATAQSVWDAPKNLEVLPADISGDALRDVMRGFTAALGVRCNHCHDDSKGSGFSDMDFASDLKPVKSTTREMMRLTRQINQTIATVTPESPPAVTVACVTCHRGNAVPVMIEDLLAETVAREGAEAAVARYRSLKESYRDGFTFDFREGPLNRLGERLLQEGNSDAAVALLTLNTEEHPSSSDAFYLLGEAYLAGDQSEAARQALEHALELNPRHRAARERLDSLEN